MYIGENRFIGGCVLNPKLVVPVLRSVGKLISYDDDVNNTYAHETPILNGRAVLLDCISRCIGWEMKCCSRN